MDFIEKLKVKARQEIQRIVLPEGTEERTIRAANRIIAEGIANIILIGDPAEIKRISDKHALANIGKATIINPKNNPNKQKYIDLMVSLRGDKGVTAEVAEKLLLERLCLGAVMVKAGDADGEVAGADAPTGEVLRPALQYVRTRAGVKSISGAFVMHIPNTNFGVDGTIIFADCAVNPDPTAANMAETALLSGETARNIVGFEPKIAMLSFSTRGSAKHPMVDKVVEATELARKMAPDMEIDGEMQADTAIIQSVGERKAPGSNVAGRANVLVFPSLECGNISYKLVERMAGAKAIGPILQGMASPINDLSRGCSIEDIVDLVTITACQAQAAKKRGE